MDDVDRNSVKVDGKYLQYQESTGKFIGTDASGGGSIAGINTTGTSIFNNLNVSGVSTFTGDVSFGSTVTFGDNDQIIMGDGPDLKLYHDGSNSYVEDAGTGALIMKGTTLRFRSTDNEKIINAHQNGSVDLFYDNFKKFETTSSGIDVTGHTETDTLNVSGISTFAGGLVEKFQTGTTLAADNTLALSDGNVIRRTSNESGNQTVNFTGVHSTLSSGGCFIHCHHYTKRFRCN